MIELATRLERRKFDKYLSADARRDFINSLLSCIDFVALKGDLRVVRDPDDDKILETAIIGRADCLVTGDKDLLALRPNGETGEARSVADATCQDVAIVRPAEFLALVEPPGARTP